MLSGYTDLYTATNIVLIRLVYLSFRISFLYSNAKRCDNLKTQAVMDSNLMTMGVKGSGNYFQRAAQVVETIENFMHSPDEQIEMEHVPNRWSSKGDGGGITIPPIQR